ESTLALLLVGGAEQLVEAIDVARLEQLIALDHGEIEVPVAIELEHIVDELGLVGLGGGPCEDAVEADADIVGIGITCEAAFPAIERFLLEAESVEIVAHR